MLTEQTEQVQLELSTSYNLSIPETKLQKGQVIILQKLGKDRWDNQEGQVTFLEGQVEQNFMTREVW